MANTLRRIGNVLGRPVPVLGRFHRLLQIRPRGFQGPADFFFFFFNFFLVVVVVVVVVVESEN